MPRNPRSIKRKLDKKVIGALGLDTVYLRSTPASGLDPYGEPIETPWPFTPFPIRIVIDTDKRDNQGSEIGGLPDRKREYVYFYCKGDVDIRMGDKLVYPANTDNQWLVDMIEPTMINNVPVICEVKAYRDPRY